VADAAEWLLYVLRTMPESRTINLVVRVSPHEKKAIERAASLAHLDRSPWIRAVLLREAERLISEARKA
jgi:uncharacterized protein (DUF1778 family)